MVGDSLQGKYFSITDPSHINTVIYQVNKTEKEFAKNAPKYTVERLEYSEEFVGEKKKKTFFVENPAPEGNPLVILSFAKEKVIINMGFLDYDVVRISKKPMPLKFKTLYNEEETDYKEFAYILKEKFENLKCIIITLGADGSYALECAKNEESFCETKDVQVLSTVGAGDSFSAAFLHQYMKGESVEFSLKYATKVAEYVVSEYDAVPEYDMKEFM